MKAWSYTEIIDKVERDLDLQEEQFITDDEMRGYVNEAIDECEAEIHNIYEDYFLTSSSVALTNGEARLPADIYANKIRSVSLATSGSSVCVLKRIRDLGFIEATTNAGNPDSYALFNPASPDPTLVAGPVIRVYPPSNSTLTVYYLRNAQRLETDDALCDIPEFVNFIIQAVKFRCLEKEGHPNMVGAAQALQKQRELMLNTLTEMVPDDENFIMGDLSHYQDHT